MNNADSTPLKEVITVPNEYIKDWRDKNKGHLRRYNKKWREENEEHLKRYYQENKEELLKNHKKCVEQWVKQNKERVLENVRKWRKTKKGEAYRQRCNFTRRTKERLVVNTLTSQEWLNILKEYNYRCAYCGIEFEVGNMPTKDHIVPVSKGGNNTKENVVPACQSCNSKKSNKFAENIIKK